MRRPSVAPKLRREPPPPERRITREELEEQLVVNRGLIHGLAIGWRKCNPRLDLEEYVSAVQMGFVRAARLFDKARGFKFATYAKWWADNEVRGLLAQYDERLGGERRRRSQRPDTDDDRAVRVMFCLDDFSPTGTDGEAVAAAGERLFAAPELRDGEITEEFWWRVRSSLTPREYDIVGMRFVDDLSLQEIGDRIGMTRERVRQILARSLAKMRKREYFAGAAGVGAEAAS